MDQDDDTPASLKEFNAKVADLIKAASPEDLVHILQSDKSLAARHNQNINNAKKAS